MKKKKNTLPDATEAIANLRFFTHLSSTAEVEQVENQS